MTYTLVTTQHFQRQARRFLRKHPDLRDRFDRVLRDLKRDPFAPHLAYRQLGGEMEGIAAVSFAHSYRITLTIVITEQEIILLDVGSHEDVYR